MGPPGYQPRTPAAPGSWVGSISGRPYGPSLSATHASPTDPRSMGMSMHQLTGGGNQRRAGRGRARSPPRGRPGPMSPLLPGTAMDPTPVNLPARGPPDRPRRAPPWTTRTSRSRPGHGPTARGSGRRPSGPGPSALDLPSRLGSSGSSPRTSAARTPPPPTGQPGPQRRGGPGAGTCSGSADTSPAQSLPSVLKIGRAHV